MLSEQHEVRGDEPIGRDDASGGGTTIVTMPSSSATLAACSGTGTAVGHEHVVARVVAALGRDRAGWRARYWRSRSATALSAAALQRQAEALRDRRQRTCCRVASICMRPPRKASGRTRSAHDMRVGERWHGCRRGRSRRDPDRRRPSAARRGSMPPSSTTLIDPPPAPIVLMSRSGMRIGRPSSMKFLGQLRHSTGHHAHIRRRAADVEA